ncbi:hypothetical protein EJD97_017308 [Solanum chilense]|uniref:Uncharacterized protein n=1 Tax=Solanum chilense TaxID=4083 RepID=A0A6N2B3B4_SOLCI|nr:hypothetical protein EJD97_017308 [Solanum chilense]
MDNNFSSVERLVAEIVGEEMKEQRLVMDIKNPQEAEMDTKKVRKRWRDNCGLEVGKEMKEEGTQLEEVDIDFSSGEGAMVEEAKEDGAEMDIDFSSSKGMVTGKVDEEMKEAGADVDTNNPIQTTKEEPFGNHLLRNSNPA